DNLTADAQAAMRRTMETYSKTSRFILSANYSSRLIEPIQSRTAVFRFRPLKPEAIREYVSRIAKAEKLKITDEGMDALVYVPDESKVRLLDRIGETDFRLTEGSSERIQIEALLAHFALIGQDLSKK